MYPLSNMLGNSLSVSEGYVGEETYHFNGRVDNYSHLGRTSTTGSSLLSCDHEDSSLIPPPPPIQIAYNDISDNHHHSHYPVQVQSIEEFSTGPTTTTG